MINNPNVATQKYINNTILRICFNNTVNDSERMKVITALSRVSQIHYKEKKGKEKKGKEKKMVCIACKMVLDNVLLLMMHIELQHSEHR